MRIDKMQAAHIRNRKVGFTLTEVVVSSGVIILSIGLFVNSFVLARREAQKADERIKAVHYARLNMETLLTNTFYNSALTIGSRPTWVTNTSVVGGVTSVYICGYTVTTTAYSTARIITLSNTWVNKRAKKTNSVIVATAVSSGFQW
jgi:type II secretory pathway pseudopilin PulG